MDKDGGAGGVSRKNTPSAPDDDTADGTGFAGDTTSSFPQYTSFDAGDPWDERAESSKSVTPAGRAGGR